MPPSATQDADVAEYLLRSELAEGSWCAQARAPGERIAVRVLGFFPLPDGSVVEDIDVLGADWRVALQRIRVHPDVFSALALRSDRDGASVRVIHKGCAVVQAVGSTGVLPRFPLRLHERREQCRLQATSVQAEEFARALRAGGMHARLHGVRTP